MSMHRHDRQNGSTTSGWYVSALRYEQLRRQRLGRELDKDWVGSWSLYNKECSPGSSLVAVGQLGGLSAKDDNVAHVFYILWGCRCLSIRSLRFLTHRFQKLRWLKDYTAADGRRSQWRPLSWSSLSFVRIDVRVERRSPVDWLL